MRVLREAAFLEFQKLADTLVASYSWQRAQVPRQPSRSWTPLGVKMHTTT